MKKVLSYLLALIVFFATAFVNLALAFTFLGFVIASFFKDSPRWILVVLFFAPGIPHPNNYINEILVGISFSAVIFLVMSFFKKKK